MKTTESLSARHPFGAALLFAIFGCLMSIASHAQSQAGMTATIADAKRSQIGEPNTAKFQTINLYMTIKLERPLSAEELKPLIKHLQDKGNYSFISDWPGADNLVELSGENPPFTPSPDQLPIVSPQTTGNAPANQWLLVLRGQLPRDSRGEIRIAQPPADVGWKLASEYPVKDGSIAVRYSFVETESTTGFRGKIQIGSGTGGRTLDITGSWMPGSPKGEVRTDMMSLGFAAKLPLGTPKDVKDTAGANKDASQKVPDMISADLNFISYRPGGDLIRAGARARATGTGKGLELVGYYAPFTGWFNEARGFYGLEGEAGYRKGDAEFKNLVTKAPNRGNSVVRIGGVAEWAPQLGGINRDLGQGLRFFVRGRGWFDSYNDDSGKRSVRFAPFVDSELFYNYAKDTRVFLRLEHGSLPPDLTEKINRIYVGVGAAF